MIQPHKHLIGCQNSLSTRTSCIACRWEAWQNAVHHVSVVGTSFAKMLTATDEELLHAMKISWK